MDLEHIDKYFGKNTRKEAPQGSILVFFLLGILKSTFWMDNLAQWSQSGPFFPKPRHFFRFSKRTGEASPLPPSWALVNVAEYWSIPLNIPKYSWKCLNKLFWLCQRSEYDYVWSSDMFNMFLKMPRVLNKPGFWIWHDFIFRVTQCSEYFWLCLSPYASLMPKYASICLNVPEYAWTWVNIAECS